MTTTSTASSPRGLYPDQDVPHTVDIDEHIHDIEEFLCRELMRVLGIPHGQSVDPRRSLHAQGVGSILALRLKRLLELNLHVEIEAVEILRAESVAELAARVALRTGNDPWDDDVLVSGAETTSSARGGSR